jgi:hypothetical protein
MPFFTSIKGQTVQLCVFTARSQQCPRKGCPYSNEPKNQRICKAFHTRGDYFRQDAERCLLGHTEARQAVTLQQKFQKNLGGNQETTHGTGDAGESNGNQQGGATGINGGGVQAGGAGAATIPGGPVFFNPNPQPANPIPNQPPNPTNAPANLPIHVPSPAANPVLNQFGTANPIQMPVQPTPPAGQSTQQTIPPAHFEDIARRNDLAGQKDEITHLQLQQEEMRKEFEAIKQQTTAKENEARLLHSSMETMNNENERLCEEVESEQVVRPIGPLSSYYADVLDKSPSTRSFLDLNKAPMSEKPLKGALIILTTMYARPVEFSGNVKIIDLVNARPITRFSNDVSSFSSLGLNRSILQHAFFAECYLKFPADPSFCPEGVMSSNLAVISLPQVEPSLRGRPY